MNKQALSHTWWEYKLLSNVLKLLQSFLNRQFDNYLLKFKMSLLIYLIGSLLGVFPTENAHQNAFYLHNKILYMSLKRMR